MNRAWWWPASGVLAVGLALVGASAVPAQQPAASAVTDDDRARVTVVCPTVVGTNEPTAVAAGSPAGEVATAQLSSPERPAVGGSSFTLDESAGEPVVVTAPRLDAFSATTRTAAAAGSDRGLSMMSCGRPSAAQWFAGVLSSGTATADLVLLNADAQDAAVDLTLYGAEGRLTAPGSRGIIVPARSRRVVPLGPLFTNAQPVSVRVSTSAGRVVAAVRQRMLNGGSPAGSDWLPPTTEPARAVVVPGLPAGKGSRDLVVVNPGDRTASVALQVLGADGPTAVPGFETIDLPPGTSRVVPLGSALAEAPVGLQLTSEQKVTAAVVGTNGAGAAAIDISTQVATVALDGPGVLALSPGAKLAPVLHLANGSAEPVRARVVVQAARPALATQPLLDTWVSVPGGADVTVELPRAAESLVGVQPETTGAIHASVAVRSDLDGVTGVASLAVLPGAAAATLPPIRQDVRVGW
ncbi:DUF5719 family protein [Micropruina sp.]|uniref:DUF5719 family protein n=1 Tax=Micropruina sp. TaxID=2737536 RepID=UPI0039E3F126